MLYREEMFRVAPPLDLKKLEAIFGHKVFKMLLANLACQVKACTGTHCLGPCSACSEPERFRTCRIHQGSFLTAPHERRSPLS